MIYPGRDDRVLRVIRKIARGLCFHHCRSVTADEQVTANILEYVVSEEIRAHVQHFHRESDIVRYQYVQYDRDEFHSIWLLTFFERTEFIAAVTRQEAIAGAA